MITIFILIFYVLACVGGGLLAMRAIAGRRWLEICAGGIPMLSSGFVLGQALLASFWVLLALMGWFSLEAVAGISLLLLVAGLPMLFPLSRAAIWNIKAWAEWLSTSSIPLRMIAAALLMLVLGFGWAAWVMPPIGDAEAFYTTYARIIAAVEKLEPMPGVYEAFSSIGLMGELHFAALIKLAGVPAAKLFVWLIGLVAAVFLAAICGAAGVKRVGQLMIWVLLFTSSTFTHYLFDGKVDLFAATLGLAAVFWVLAIARGGRLALAMAGLCTGFAVVAKFSYALGFVPAIVALLVWRELGEGKINPGKVRSVALSITVFGLWAVLAVVPHLIKNSVLFGAPFTPFIGGGQGWLNQVWFAPDVIHRLLLTYPLALVFGQYPMQEGNLSWLWLALLPLAWWIPRPTHWNSSIIVQLCTAGMIGVVLWVIFRPSVIAPRYFLATLLLFYPLVAKAAEKIFIQEEAEAKWFVWGTSAVILVAILVAARYPHGTITWYAIRGEGRACALASYNCVPLSKLGQEAEEGSRVYFAGYYTYWLRDDLLLCRDQGKETQQELSWESLAEGGFQWLVVDMTTHSRVWENLSILPKPDGLMTQIYWDSKEVLILRLEGVQKAGTVCRKTVPPAWEVVRIGTGQ